MWTYHLRSVVTETVNVNKIMRNSDIEGTKTQEQCCEIRQARVMRRC